MSSPFDTSSLWRRIQRALGIDEPRPGGLARTSRREREQQNTRMLIATLAIVAVLAVVSLAGGLYYENIVKPNAVLARVGGEEITREEYWKYASMQMYQQADQYEAFAEQVEGSQRTQFLTMAAQFRGQADLVWGTTEVSDPTLALMVEDQVYLEAAEEMGLDISDQSVEAFALQQFAPEGAELVTPFPQPTMIPQREIWATETAEAQATEQAEMAAMMGTPVASPVAEGTPGATPVADATPGATPVASGTPDAAGTPNASATPIDREQALTEANQGFTAFQDDAFGKAHVSLDDYYRLVARPQLARELVTGAINAEVPQTASQVKASHILVSTEDLARELYERATGGADFEQLARSNSIDQATAPTGGDLGWFTEDQMVEPFSEAAFSLEPGSISQPVQTQFGWHIIKVEEKDEDRALTDLQYQQAQERAVQATLAETRAGMDISSDADIEPTPSPTPAEFNPPPDAPTPIPATPVPGTPGATPVGTPGATPIIEGPVLATPDGSD
jgi:parvulin-like peptidyl-prolyl isomerase